MTVELQSAFIGTFILLYGIQWVAVNLENDKKLYNITFILCGLMQLITFIVFM